MKSAQFKDYNLYSEEPTSANHYRQEYSDSLNNYICTLREKSTSNRETFLTPEMLIRNHELYRNKYIQMLGIPLTEYTSEVPEGTEEYVASDDLADIYRVSISVMPMFSFYGIIMIPNKTPKCNKLPLVICQHGGGGTPELCSDMHGDNNYSHMTRRMLEYGVCVFAPQLYLWNSNNYIIP